MSQKSGSQNRGLSIGVRHRGHRLGRPGPDLGRTWAGTVTRICRRGFNHGPARVIICVSGDAAGAPRDVEVLHESAARRLTRGRYRRADQQQEPGAAVRRRDRTARHRPRHRGGQGPRRKMADADRLRRPHRAHLRRSRHPGPAGRRLGRDGRVRARDHDPGHAGRPDPADRGGGPRHQPGHGRRRPAVRLLPGLVRGTRWARPPGSSRSPARTPSSWRAAAGSPGRSKTWWRPGYRSWRTWA